MLYPQTGKGNLPANLSTVLSDQHGTTTQRNLPPSSYVCARNTTSPLEISAAKRGLQTKKVHIIYQTPPCTNPSKLWNRVKPIKSAIRVILRLQ